MMEMKTVPAYNPGWETVFSVFGRNTAKSGMYILMETGV